MSTAFFKICKKVSSGVTTAQLTLLFLNRLAIAASQATSSLSEGSSERGSAKKGEIRKIASIGRAKRGHFNRLNEHAGEAGSLKFPFVEGEGNLTLCYSAARQDQVESSGRG